MLKAKSLQALLGSANVGLVRTTLLVAADGRLLAHATSKQEHESEEVIASTVAQAWSEYSNAAAGNFDEPQLNFLLLDTDTARLGVAAVDDRFLVCCVALPTMLVKDIKTLLGNLGNDLRKQLSFVGADAPPGTAMAR